MANPLTGDFEAVLQVNGSTLNRLLASMHQNGFAKPELPSFPHGDLFRIGDYHAVDGVRGAVRAQVGVPRLELIHGAKDRFRLEVGVTARYTPDPGSEPLPEFIHGVVRAEYSFSRVDPDCRGWRGIAADFIWIRAVEGSVSFTGTAVDDLSPLAIPVAVDEAQVQARITRQVEAVLRMGFEAVPHRVSTGFGPGSIRSLSAPIGGSAVAIPIGLSSPAPSGSIDSVDSLWLDGRDFGLAVSRDYILSRVQSVLDDLKGSFTMPLQLKGSWNLDLLVWEHTVKVDITWAVRLTTAWAEWLGPVPPLGSSAVVAIHLSGVADTGEVASDTTFDIAFDVTQQVLIAFDANAQRLSVTRLGDPTVGLHGTYAGLAEAYAKPRIAGAVRTQLDAELPKVNAGLGIGNGPQELITQLQTLDDQADAYFDEAVFGPYGVILRGAILLAPRRGPVHKVAKTYELDAFSAFESWFPGGRIDSFEWSWTWFNGFGEAGKASRSDRFILTRPRPSGQGGAGDLAGSAPLPGLDGMGTVCLNVSGVQVDPRTGDLVPVHGGRRCRRYGYDVAIHLPEGVGRLYARERPPGPPRPEGPPAEAGLLELGTALPATRVNTLVLDAGEAFDRELGATLREGVAGGLREHAGLLVLVLFAEGRMPAAGEPAAEELRELVGGLGAPLLATEDVDRGWSYALGLEPRDGESAWRLVSPGGGVTWMHDGRLGGRELAGVLAEALRPSPAPSARSWGLAVEVGERVSGIVFKVPPCPPVPLDRIGIGSLIGFVHGRSCSSRDHLERLDRRYREEAGATFVAAVVDGADAEQADALARELDLELPLVADPRGSKARRLGVRTWPTTVALSASGVVLSVDDGAGADAPELRDQNGEEASTE